MAIIGFIFLLTVSACGLTTDFEKQFPPPVEEGDANELDLGDISDQTDVQNDMHVDVLPDVGPEGWHDLSALVRYPITVQNVTTEPIGNIPIAVLGLENQKWKAFYNGVEIPTELEDVLWVLLPELPVNGATFYLYPGETGSTLEPADVWSDFVGVWHNGAFSDASENGNDGIRTDVGITPGGAFGLAGEFNGTSSYIFFQRTPDFSFTDVTIEGWVEPAQTQTGTQTFLSKWSGIPTADFALFFGAKEGVINHQTFAVETPIETSGGAISPSTWTHIAMVQNNVGIRLFVDGELSGMRVFGDPGTLNGMNNVIVGATSTDGATYQSFLNGRIDELRISPQQKPDAWIAQSAAIRDPGVVDVGVVEERP